jgi:hypothetical protein
VLCSTVVTIYRPATCFNIKKFCCSPTYYLYVLPMIVSIESHCFGFTGFLDSVHRDGILKNVSKTLSVSVSRSVG